jgi:hypothetical protein
MDSVPRGIGILLWDGFVEDRLEVLQLFGPEALVVVQPVNDRLEAVRTCAVIGVAAVAPRAYQAHGAQGGKVLRDGRLGDLEFIHELRDGVFLLGEQLEDSEPGGVAEGAEESGSLPGMYKHWLMNKCISIRLWVVKRICRRRPAAGQKRAVGLGYRLALDGTKDANLLHRRTGAQMSDSEILNNQGSILKNQKDILENQQTIKKNQKVLEQILSNQKEILTNQQEILSNQKEILAAVKK